MELKQIVSTNKAPAAIGPYSQAVVAGGHVAPAQQLQAVMPGRLGQGQLALPAQRGVPGQEDHGHAVAPGRGQVDTAGLGLLEEELVRDLEEHPRAVAGGLVAAGGAAMHQVQQHLPAIVQDGVLSPAVDVDHGPDAAGVVLVLRVVQPLGSNRPHSGRPFAGSRAPGDCRPAPRNCLGTCYHIVHLRPRHA